MTAIHNIEALDLVTLMRRRAIAAPSALAYTFLANGEERAHDMTYEDLAVRALRLAATLQASDAKGERAVIIASSGLEFPVAFFGVLAAGAIAVPVPPPRPHRSATPFAAILADSRPKFVLAAASVLNDVKRACQRIALPHVVQWIPVDVEPHEVAIDRSWAPAAPDAIAYLQYTSGSTGTPRGVMLTHANVLANMRMIAEAFAPIPDRPVLSWLPLYHDMGLISAVLQPLYLGVRSIFMNPFAFLQRPQRWLAAISRHGAATSGGPNFAYDICARKVRPEEIPMLDLSGWSLAFCGAEPIRPATLDRFAATFARAGFRRSAFYPCYGLAEATLFVTGGTCGRGPQTIRFHASALAADRAVVSQEASDSRTLVSCGRPREGLSTVIVDPRSGRPCADGTVGEIWLSGDNVARGYWNRPQESSEVFSARTVGHDNTRFLRTGDLGFLFEGELYVTGRCKDLIIIDGTNHYPQDIEATIEGCHPALRPASAAAFAVDGERGERLAVVAEIDGGRVYASLSHAAADVTDVIRAIRRAIGVQHDLSPERIVLLEPGGTPRTTSGKVQRGRCRQLLAEATLPVVAQWSTSEERKPRATPAGFADDDALGWEAVL